MSATLTIRTHLIDVRRKDRSPNGNPRWILRTTDGIFLTGIGASCAYYVSDGWSDAAVELTLDPRDRVIGIVELGRAAR